MPKQIRAWLFVAATLGISIALLPLGVALVGAVLGGVTSLLAIGLVLAYRAHRFINIGHASLGAVAGSAVAYLVVHAGWSFWAAYPLGLACGAVLGTGAGIVLGERLADASRTVVVVASLGLSFLFGAAHVGLGLVTGSVSTFEVPLGLSVDVFPVRLSGTHLFAAISVPLALAAVWLFLQHSDTGLRVRALAGNSSHARRLGVSPQTTWRILWAVIGVLAAAGGIIAQPLQGTTVASGPLLGPLLVALAAAAVAGMRALPLTVATSVALGVAYQAILWRTTRAAAADVALFAVIAVAFAARPIRDRLSDREDPSHWRLVRSPRPAAARFGTAVLGGRVAIAFVIPIGTVIALRFLDVGDAQRVGAVAVFALAGLSVHVMATLRGRLTLGAWALVGVGALAAGTVGAGTIEGVAAAVGAGAAASVFLALLASRGDALAYAAVTLAASFAFPATVKQIALGAPYGFRVGSLVVDSPASIALVIVTITSVAAFGVATLRRSWLGRNALAVREDHRLARVHGVRVVWTTLAVDAVAGGLAGLAGVMYLWNQRVVHPDAFAALRSLELAAMVVLGGIGSVIGPLLGAVAVKGSELFARGPMHLLATGLGLLFIVLWLRGGLVSIVEIARNRLAERGRHPVERRRTEPAPRFCPAPEAETRKARAHPIVRHAAVLSALSGTVCGIALRVAVGSLDPSTALWLIGGGVAVFCLGAVAGFKRPRPAPTSGAAVVCAVAAAFWTPALVLVLVAIGCTFGAALRSGGDGVPHSIAAASRGWITAQAATGSVIGGVLFGAASRADLWLIGCASALVVVAATREVWTVRGTPPSTESLAPLVLSGLDVGFGGHRLLQSVSLEVSAGEIVGIAGPNGSGKTTLLRCIAGEIRPQRGSIVIRRCDATVFTSEEVFRLGVLLSDAEHGSNGELTVRENLRLAALAMHPRAHAGDVVTRASALHPAIRDRVDAPAAVLSGGERRLLALAQAVAVQPPVLLVDELARGLSSNEMEIYTTLIGSLAERGAAVVVVDHAADRLRPLAHRILQIRDGRLVAERTSPVSPSGVVVSRS